MTKHAGQSRWLRLLRTTAHLAIATMWFIAVATYVPNLLQLSLFNSTMEADVQPPPSVTTPIAVPNSAVIVAAIGGVLILFLLFLVIKRFYIPATDKAVEHMTETAQKQILVTLEKRQPKIHTKEKQRISRYAIEATYLLLIAAPILVLFIGQPIQSETVGLLAKFILSVLALYAIIVVIIFYSVGNRVLLKANH